MARLRVRYVNEGQVTIESLTRAIEQGRTIIGGDVCNTYGWPAETECVVAAASPNGIIWTSDVKRIPGRIRLL